MSAFKLNLASARPKHTQGNQKYPVIKVYASAYEKLVECSISTGEPIMSIATQAIEYALTQLENGGDDES
jgi:hypothetical protein